MESSYLIVEVYPASRVLMQKCTMCLVSRKISSKCVRDDGGLLKDAGRVGRNR